MYNYWRSGIAHFRGAQQPGRPIDGALRELRVRFANTHYRVLYERSGNLVALLHAFEKRTGAVPEGDAELALRRMADFKRRMDAKPRVPPRAAGHDAGMGRRRGTVGNSYRNR